MKWIAHDAESNFLLMEIIEKLPEIRMQNRISPGQVNIRAPAYPVAKGYDLICYMDHVRVGHGDQIRMSL